VHVSVVEPGNYNSISARTRSRESARTRKLRIRRGNQVRADRSNFKEPDEVAMAVEQALLEPNPKRRYMVVPNQDEAEITIRKQIEQARAA